jgi:signal transduction histidine kinase
VKNVIPRATGRGIAHEINNPVNFIHGNLYLQRQLQDLIRSSPHIAEFLRANAALRCLIDDIDGLPNDRPPEISGSDESWPIGFEDCIVIA